MAERDLQTDIDAWLGPRRMRPERRGHEDAVDLEYAEKQQKALDRRLAAERRAQEALRYPEDDGGAAVVGHYTDGVGDEHELRDEATVWHPAIEALLMLGRKAGGVGGL